MQPLSVPAGETHRSGLPRAHHRQDQLREAFFIVVVLALIVDQAIWRWRRMKAKWS
jgi:hypothetical protein